jgi:hypothetical protein
MVERKEYMIEEKLENGLFTIKCDGEILLTITDMGNNIYRAVNKGTDMTAEIIPLEPHKVSIRSIEHKRTDKVGRRRQTNKLLESDLNWLWYMLQEKGFEQFATR